jgi:hypothetical protein
VASSLAAGAATERVPSADALPDGALAADLCLFHVVDPEPATGALRALTDRLRPEVPVVAVLPQADTRHMIEVLKDPRVVAAVSLEPASPSALCGLLTKLLYGDVFGLEKLMPWGARLYAQAIADYPAKSSAITLVTDFAAKMGVRRRYRDAIAQATDELLMNALYDAPVDAAGKPCYVDVPPGLRAQLHVEPPAVLQFGCDGRRFGLSVRDSFGRLTKEHIVQYIEKCQRSPEQIDRKAGGAGLGRFLVVNAATEVHVHIYPGVATEAACVFDLTADAPALTHLGVYIERVETTGRLHTDTGDPPAPVPVPRRHRRWWPF